MSRKIIVPPSAEPITLAVAKLHCKVSGAAEDTLIPILISAVREECEGEVKRALITQTWESYFDAFPDVIELPLPPLQGVTSVKYVDVDGSLQTLATTEYLIDDKQEPSRLLPAFGKTWPATRAQTNAVTVRFICGYGAAGTNIPQNLLNWMLVRLNTLYQHRETVLAGGLVGKFDHIDGLLDRYRVRYIP